MTTYYLRIAGQINNMLADLRVVNDASSVRDVSIPIME